MDLDPRHRSLRFKLAGLITLLFAVVAAFVWWLLPTSVHPLIAGAATLGVLLLGLLAGFGIAAIVLGRIPRMRDVARSVARGDLSLRELPTTPPDELGQMGEAFNLTLRWLRELTAAAEGVARGDLTVRLQLEGQVAEVFNHMVEGQRKLVRQMAETSIQLGSATAEIYAAAQEQEAAAAQQAAGMEEVSKAMESLLSSAAHIAASAGAVLANAERNKDTTEATSKRVAELSAHTGRMGELLEGIREIADRSDLLALNASLEATRAGESGRAFSLVAGEMRRLAERVTGSVEGVKSLVADVRAFGSSTVMGIEEVRKLAESSTSSARQITMVTEQQRTATEEVLESMRAIASVLAQSVTAAQETRSSAEALKGQAERLTSIVTQFHLGEGRRIDE